MNIASPEKTPNSCPSLRSSWSKSLPKLSSKNWYFEIHIVGRTRTSMFSPQRQRSSFKSFDFSFQSHKITFIARFKIRNTKGSMASCKCLKWKSFHRSNYFTRFFATLTKLHQLANSFIRFPTKTFECCLVDHKLFIKLFRIRPEKIHLSAWSPVHGFYPNRGRH